MIERHVLGVVMTALSAVGILAGGLPEARARQIGSVSAVPDEAAQEKARKLIREVFEEEFEGAKSPSERTSLARKMLGQAGESADDPVHRFVLLRMAREMAIGAANADVAIEAVDRMAAEFAIDADAARVECLEEVSQAARLSSQFRVLARRADPLIDRAVAIDDYDAAERLGKLAVAAAQKAREFAMAKQLTTKMEGVAEAKAAFAEVEEALAKLDESPVDPDANLTAGRFYCLTKGNWDRGVAMLALGSDPELRSLAMRELEEATSPDAQIALGDGWWDLAGTREGQTKDGFLLRAGYWYERARSKATSGLAKVRLEKRLDEIAKIERPGALAGGAPSAVKRTADGRSIKPFDPTAVEPSGMLQGHTSWIYALAFTLDGSILVSGGGDRVIRFWTMATGQPRSALPPLREQVRGLALHPDGNSLAIVGTGPNVGLWNLRRGPPAGVLVAHEGRTLAAAFTPDGSQLATCGSDQTVKLWEIPSGKLLHTMHGHSADVDSIAVSPDGSMLASGGSDRTVLLWEVSSGDLLATLQGHVWPVQVVAFSPDGSMLASGGRAPEVIIWDVAGRKARHTLQGHSSSVSAVAFHPSGSPLASGSGDQTIMLWDPESGGLKGTIQSDSAVTSVAFSPDGSTLLAGGRGTLNLWRSNPGRKSAPPAAQAATAPRETEMEIAVSAGSPFSETPARRQGVRGSRLGAARGAQAWILLPPLVDAERDCRDASWKWDDETAEFGAGRSRAYVTFPVNVLGSYELEARVTIVQAKETTAIHLPVAGDKAVILDIRGDSGNSASATATMGLRGVNPPAGPLGRASMNVGTEHAIACKVMVLAGNVAVEVRRDDQVVLQWSGTAAQVAPTPAMLPGTVGLETAYYTSSRFRDLRLRMLSGQATPRFPDSSTAARAEPDPGR